MERQAEVEQVSFSIDEFLKRNHLSLGTYYKLKNAGRGPAEMRLGPQLVRISAAAESAWHARMSNPDGPEAALKKMMQARATQRSKHAGALASLSPAHVSNVARMKRGSLSEAQKRLGAAEAEAAAAAQRGTAERRPHKSSSSRKTA